MGGRSQPADLDEGVVLVLAGEGWGKSAAALGYVGRAWARGWRACVVQFLKGAAWNVAERALAAHLEVEWHTFDPGMAWGAGKARDPVEQSRRAWQVAADRMRSGTYHLVVLDELGNALAAGWLAPAEVVTGLSERHEGTNVIITGRQVPDAICEVADTVTRYERAKHRAQRGILC
jgi:cob(I)alamin adenosyltransferase